MYATPLTAPGSGVKKVGGLGLGLMGKAYNAATGKKSLPAAPEEVKQRVKSTRHKDASDSGGIACKDVATVKDQRSVFSEVIKQIGKNVFAGRDLMCAFSTPLPPPPSTPHLTCVSF